MNLNEEKTFNRLVAWSRKHMPRWVVNSSGQVVGLRSPDGTFQVTGSGTAQPVTWDSITDKPSAFPATWAGVAGKPAYAAVATSGAYSDLTGRPSLFSGAYADLTGLPALFPGTWAALTGKPTLFDGTWASLTGKPTTLAGFGITDAVTGAALGNYTTTAALTALLAAKADASTVKRIDTYTGTTDANGLYTVAYATAFAAVPSVQPSPPTAANQTWVTVSSTAAGFSLRLVQRSAVTLLSVEVLLAGTTNVAGAPARVVVVAA